MRTKQVITDYYLTPHFRVYELMCKETKTFPEVNKDMINFLFALEDFRVWFKKPMNINCGYRSPQFNNRVGGSSKSNHLTATAIDWGIRHITPDMSPERLREWREHVVEKWLELGKKYGYFIEVEINPTWIHLSFNTNVDKNQNRVGLANGAKNTAGSNFKDYYSRGAVFK